jgi:hypothetical protein
VLGVLVELHLGQVVEWSAGDAGKEAALYGLGLGLDGLEFLQNPILCRREQAVETAKDRERQNDFAVLIPFVGASEQIADAPDEIRQL